MSLLFENEEIKYLKKETDWFEQFDFWQKKIINEGLEEKLNVSIYAKPDIEWRRMRDIKNRLLIGKDVSDLIKVN